LIVDQAIFKSEGQIGDACERFASRKRLEDQVCAPRASWTYLAILDSMAAMNEVLKKICVTLLSLGTTSHAGEAALEQALEKSE